MLLRDCKTFVFVAYHKCGTPRVIKFNVVYPIGTHDFDMALGVYKQCEVACVKQHLSLLKKKDRKVAQPCTMLTASTSA
jgi:hypothetical protein